MHIFNPIQDLDPSDTYSKKWNQMKTIHIIVRTSTTHHRTPRFIKESVKKTQEKYKYWNSAEPGTYIMWPHKASLNFKFEGSNWKIDPRNAKNV